MPFRFNSISSIKKKVVSGASQRRFIYVQLVILQKHFNQWSADKQFSFFMLIKQVKEIINWLDSLNKAKRADESRRKRRKSMQSRLIEARAVLVVSQLLESITCLDDPRREWKVIVEFCSIIIDLHGVDIVQTKWKVHKIFCNVRNLSVIRKKCRWWLRKSPSMELLIDYI